MIEERTKKLKREVTDATILDAIGDNNKPAVVPIKGSKSKSGIIVKGIHDLAVRFSKCCSPVPGDEIVGFVDRGRGITIHRTDCINVLNLPEIERSRLIDAEWQGIEEDNSAATYSTEILDLREQPDRNVRGYLQDLYRTRDRHQNDELPRE